MWHDARTLNVVANILIMLAVFVFLMAGIIWVAKQAYFNLSVIEFETMPGAVHAVSLRSLRAAILGHQQGDSTGTPQPDNSVTVQPRNNAIEAFQPDNSITAQPWNNAIEAFQQDNSATVQSLHHSGIRHYLGNFFTVDLNQVRQTFETVPWVRRATVYRVWPNALRIYLETQQPLARWNKNQMLNTWGEAFSVHVHDLNDKHLASLLPHFYGPPGSESLVVQRYAELVRWFAPLDLHVNALRLSPRYAWRVTLSNGLTLDLGRDPGADALYSDGSPGALPFAARLQRFVQAWPIVMQKLAGRSLVHVDLRYPNGFALALAPLSQPNAKTSLKSSLKKYGRHDSRH